MTTFLSFNENFNSKLTFTAEDSAETEEMLRKDLPLSHRWSVWEQIMPTSESKGIYADATQKVASFGTVQDFWRFWNHIPQPSELLEQKRLVREHPDGLRVIDALMIFQENIRPEWEDKMNANGGHFQFQLKPSCGGGQIDEYWNNLVMGMIGATIDPPNMITGVRLVDKLSGPRATNVIRIEVWFTENEDSQAIGTLRKNVEKCMAHKLDGAHGTVGSRPPGAVPAKTHPPRDERFSTELDFSGENSQQQQWGTNLPCRMMVRRSTVSSAMSH